MAEDKTEAEAQRLKASFDPLKPIVCHVSKLSNFEQLDKVGPDKVV